MDAKGAKPMTKHRMVVRPHRPLRNGMVYAALTVLVALAIASAFEFGRLRAGFDADSAGREQDRMTSEIDALTGENRELRERIALLERSSEIDREAREQVQANLAAMQDEVLELREELAFYRGIVSPEDAQAGLRIQSFKLATGPDGGLYHFRLVLIQAIKHDRRATGSVEVVVHGVRDGQPVSMSLQELVTAETDELAYSFKYFQDFEGDIRLPDGFVPARVDIAVMPGGRASDAIRRTIQWTEAVS